MCVAVSALSLNKALLQQEGTHCRNIMNVTSPTLQTTLQTYTEKAQLSAVWTAFSYCQPSHDSSAAVYNASLQDLGSSAVLLRSWGAASASAGGSSCCCSVPCCIISPPRCAFIHCLLPQSWVPEVAVTGHQWHY